MSAINKNILISISKVKNGYSVTTLVRTRKNSKYHTVNDIYCTDLSYGPISEGLFCCNGDTLICNIDVKDVKVMDLTQDDIFRGLK